MHDASNVPQEFGAVVKESRLLPALRRLPERASRGGAAAAMGTPRLSGALTISDANDFLAPAAACVLPLGGGAVAAVAPARPAPPGSVLAPIVPVGAATSSAPVAAVSLSDCLSCSGCVTSAETVLLAETNLEHVRAALLEGGAGDGVFVVAALSQQAVASVAVELGIGLQRAAGVLAAFFKDSLRVDAVVDLAFARHLVMEEAAREFVRRKRAGEAVVIASACPGWVTYAEKTQGEEVLRTISRVRSPQAAAGAVVPRIFGAPKAISLEGGDGGEGGNGANGDGEAPRRRTWLLAVMPCHDKKLEAARPGFSGASAPGEPDVQAVLTASEVLQLASELGVNLSALEPAALDERCAAGPEGFGTDTGSGSGGYADYVLRVAARELLGVDVGEGRVEMEKVSRSGDVRAVTVESKDGTRRLRFGTAYGFRSLQSVLRKVRRGECDYDYIELMACPGGCNNGGGQVPVVAGDKKVMAEQLAEVEAVYATATNRASPRDVPGVVRLRSDLGQAVESVLYTAYERREQNVIAAVNNW